MRLARGNRVALLSVALVVALSACASVPKPVDLATVDSVERPSPVGVEVNPAPPSTSAAPAPDCDPTASLRPPDPMPAPGAMPSGSTMREIQEAGKLVAGVDQNTYLFGFRDPTTNQLEGFDIDRARDIAEAIFGDRTKIQFKVMTSAGRIPALVNEEVDVVVRTFTATCQRWEEVNFSATYFMAGQRLLVERGSEVTTLDDLGGEKVCAAEASTSIKTIAEHEAEPVPVQVENWSDCLVMLQQGQVAAVSTDNVILAGMAAQDPNLTMVGPTFTPEPYGIGVPKGNEDMVGFVNGVLEQTIASGEWARSYDRWLGGIDGPRPAPPTPTYRD
ncbi:glutamate ABC transporter substrate-binding protein [Actinophytocola gossypii]|uniref:Transporter substrate-binding domain-containing protein n=1 Tax=Actinophytocola gossypii TaxID=2812003 RepID=A0ABT2JDC3_9PSEU|nr:transporter substrate-binding domain-containing protein [Actinophytocola gossypii]MCT2585781.1 transporter substrate-binding domain-containing protein [Actinophytocola gossypii]